MALLEPLTTLNNVSVNIFNVMKRPSKMVKLVEYCVSMKVSIKDPLILLKTKLSPKCDANADILLPSRYGLGSGSPESGSIGGVIQLTSYMSHLVRKWKVCLFTQVKLAKCANCCTEHLESYFLFLWTYLYFLYIFVS